MVSFASQILKTDLFRGLTESDLEHLFNIESCAVEKYAKNALVILEADTCKSVGLILKGTLSVQQSTNSGESVTIATLNEGDSFGEAMVFNSDSRYCFSLRTETSSTILYIPFEKIIAGFRTSETFNLNYIAFLSRRIQMFQNKIQILCQRDVHTRLQIYLAGECKRQDSLSFRLAHTKTEIAEIIGVARPSVSHEFSRMQQEKLIELDHRNIRILKSELFGL